MSTSSVRGSSRIPSSACEACSCASARTRPRTSTGTWLGSDRRQLLLLRLLGGEAATAHARRASAVELHRHESTRRLPKGRHRPSRHARCRRHRGRVGHRPSTGHLSSRSSSSSHRRRRRFSAAQPTRVREASTRTMIFVMVVRCLSSGGLELLGIVMRCGRPQRSLTLCWPPRSRGERLRSLPQRRRGARAAGWHRRGIRQRARQDS